MFTYFHGRKKIFSLVIATLLLPAIVQCNPAKASNDVKLTKSNISVAVLGDSLAVGLFSGLTQLFRKQSGVKIRKYSRVNTGLVRYDRYNWTNAAGKIAKKDKSQIYVLMFGANDLQTIRVKGKSYHFKTEGWLKLYTSRIDAILASIKKSRRKVYWVGLPIVGKASFSKGYRYLNEIFRKRAKANGVTFIDSWDWFASESGKFQMSGKGADGRKKLLRAQDRVHFTPQGYIDLGRYVAREIKILKK